MPDDGRVLALAATALLRRGDLEQAATVFQRALAAIEPAPPGGTGLRGARALLALVPRRPLEARAALRADTGTFADEEALGQLLELETEIGSPTVRGGSSGVEEVQAAITELRERKGREALAKAGAAVGTAHPEPDAATTATELLPENPIAWRTRGWYELRSATPERAAGSFRRAIALSKDPAAERTRILAWYRLAGRAAPNLDGNDAP